MRFLSSQVVERVNIDDGSGFALGKSFNPFCVEVAGAYTLVVEHLRQKNSVGHQIFDFKVRRVYREVER